MTFYSEEAFNEYMDDMTSFPTTLSDAHQQWHQVNGWDKVCDLDCGVGEWDDYEPEEDFDDDAAEYWQTYGEPEAREEMSAQEYNLFEFGIDPPF